MALGDVCLDPAVRHGVAENGAGKNNTAIIRVVDCQRRSPIAIDGGDGGVGASNGAHVTVTDSVLTNNATVAVASSASPGTTTKVMVSRTTIVRTGIGLMATAEATGTAILVSDANVFNEITFAAFYFPGLGGTETIYSYGNNKIGPDIVAELGGSATSIGLH